MHVFAVCYRDKDGFFQYSVDAKGRVLTCATHDAALASMCDQIDYCESLLAGEPKYKVVPKRKFGIIRSSEIVRDGIEYKIPEYEKERVRRELNTICVRKVRILG